MQEDYFEFEVSLGCRVSKQKQTNKKIKKEKKRKERKRKQKTHSNTKELCFTLEF